MSKIIIVSALLLNGDKCGYGRVIKNLVLHYSSPKCSSEYKLIFFFQKSGWNSLELKLTERKTIKIILVNDFKSKWTRGFCEQLLIPIFSLKYKAHKILMPFTFGLLFPIRPVVTFVHTNTSFSVSEKIRGRNKPEQFVQKVMTRLTAITSSTLVYTSSQTHKEHNTFCKKYFPPIIIGNCLIEPKTDIKLHSFNPKLVKRGYLLTVSQIYRLKNFDSLIKAFIKNKTKNLIIDEMQLVIVGAIKELDYYNELLDLTSKRKDIHFLHNISESELSCLYLNAKGYCFFSYFEGYSLTPAEAMLAKLPVAISDIPTHREIYENSVFYADPLSISSIAAALRNIANYSHKKNYKNQSLVINKFSKKSFIKKIEASFTH
jgi:glycosyltransferase involved in cell wall biosynthesis